MRLFGIVALIVSLGAACKEDRDAVDRPSAPTDSLYRLYRQLLVGLNPHVIQQAIVCENVRLLFKFGLDAGNDSLRVTRKQAYGSRDRARLKQVHDGLRGHVFDAGEDVCGKVLSILRRPTVRAPTLS